MALPLWNPTGNYGVDNSMNNLNNQTAYLPGTNEDKMMKSLYEMKSTYGDTPAYQQNLQKDWDNYKKTGEPLSLPKKEYSGVEGFASLNNLGDNRYVDSGMFGTDANYSGITNTFAWTGSTSLSTGLPFTGATSAATQVYFTC